MAAIGYMLAVAIYVRISPDAGPASIRIDWRERLKLSVSIWHVLLIFITMISGIYMGWFTPTEGAAVGAFGTEAGSVFSEKTSILRNS